jgi:phenylalanyl-tRNA synthetase alpha chain
MELKATHVAVLETADATEARSVDALADDTGAPPESVAGAAFDLAERGLVDVTERVEETVELTEEGESYRDAGLPEVRLYRAARDAGATAEDAVPMGEVIGASDLGDAVDIALANYARKGYGVVDSGEIAADPDADPDADPEAAALDALAGGESVDEDVREDLARRNLVEVHERTVRFVELTEDGVTALMEGVEATDAVGQVTPELLSSGEWQDAEFAEYDVAADADVEYGGKEHVLRQTAERVKDVLVGMGFQEMDGPHADAEF